MSKPILLHYYLTQACNAKCVFCDIWKIEKPSFANADDVFSNLENAKKMGCKFVDFTGGEPLMHKDLPLFLKKAKQLGFITSVTTNTLLFKKRAEQLAGLVDLLHFSIDADQEALHDEIRGVKSWQSVLDCIPIALQNNLVPDLLFTFTNENIDAFEGLLPIAKKYKLSIILDPVFSTDGTNLLTDETIEKAKKLSKLKRVYLNNAHLVLRSQGSNNIDKPSCYAVSSTIVISPDNKLLLPCYHNCSKKIDINSNLDLVYKSDERKAMEAMQGKFDYCKSCHINCYFDPSYIYKLNKLNLISNISKFKYSFQKYVLDGHSFKNMLFKFK